MAERDIPSNQEVERAFGVLETLGIPRERARSVQNGIIVLDQRYAREIAALRAEVKRLNELVADHEEARRTAGETPVARSFQDRVFDWARDCFGEKDTTSREIRTFRFLEEALELAQACGCSQDAAERVLAYVYGRPAGEVAQEVGGVMVSLAVLCQSFQIGMSRCGEAELARVLGKIEHIRARHAAKPDFAVPAPKTPPAPGWDANGSET